jgi:clan AA aspartic protease (TIGR02281 family)
MSLELPPHIGLACPLCHRAIPEARLHSPWCECGWHRRGRRFWPIGLPLALGLVGVALVVGAGRTGLPPPVPGVPAAQPRLAVEAPLALVQPPPAVPPRAALAAAAATPGPADLLRLARQLVADGALHPAAELYRKALKLDPALAEAHAELGLLCADLGDFACAELHLARARKLRPDDVAILEDVAAIARDAGKIQPAVDTYREITRLDPRHENAARQLARTLDAAERWDEAAAAYRAYLDRFGDSPEAAELRRRFEELIEPDTPRGSKRLYSVPIRRSGSALLVEGQVEDASDVRFLLDTGATLTVISSELARELGFNPQDRGLQRVRLHTANGAIQAPLITLETVKLGNVIVRNVPAAIFDIRAVDPIDGLLGLSFLDRFRFTIDQRGRVMHLEPR